MRHWSVPLYFWIWSHDPSDTAVKDESELVAWQPTKILNYQQNNSESHIHFSATQNLKVLLGKHLPGEWEILFFWQMREEELWDFVTQEAQSVSAHWCSELAGLSLWSPINSGVRLLPPSPSPRHQQRHQEALVFVFAALCPVASLCSVPACGEFQRPTNKRRFKAWRGR